MSWTTIQAAIDEAEKVVPSCELSVQVVADRPTLPSPDETKYQQLRRELVGAARARLDQDYTLWQLTWPLMEQIIQTAMQNSDPSLPSLVKTRLTRPLVRPPRVWRLCSVCNGTATGELGYCLKCQGGGYEV
jgi:hypothetical protein